MTPVASLEKVCQAFGDRFALRNLDLTIQPGERIALIGSNGAGKTTLLRILATLASPSSGTVQLFGLNPGDDLRSIRRKLGVLFVEGFLYGELTVSENLQLYTRLYGLSDGKARIQRWLDRVSMTRFSEEPVRNLSRGERQRIALIRSLIHEPTFLLWDEPATGLDTTARLLLNEIVKERSGSCTLVCATHDPEDMKGWTDRTLTLKEGRLV